MPNLNLNLDAALLQQVRVVAQRDQTTIHAIVRELLSRYTESRARQPECELRQPERASRMPGLVIEPRSRERSVLHMLQQAS